MYICSMQILSAKYVISSAEVAQCPKPTLSEFAFIGRSNVGKSSLINLVTGTIGLAKTSGTPGKTQLINHFKIESRKSEKKPRDSWFLVDLPGYGFAKVSQENRKKWEKMIEDYLRKRTNLINVFLLVDSRHSPQKIDIDFVNQLGEWQIPFVIVFTKIDKEKPGAVKRNVVSFIKELSETWETPPRYFQSSAEKKIGRDEILTYIEECNKEVEGINFLDAK